MELDERRLLDIAQAATYLSGTVFFVRTLIWDHEVPFLKIGKRYCIDRADLDRWIAGHKQREGM